MNRQILLEIIDQCAQQFVVEPCKVEESSLLFASGGLFDSINLVGFLMELEQRIAKESGRPIALISDKAMSRKSSPFRAAGDLADFVLEIQNDEK